MDGKADSPFFPNEFLVNASPMYRDGTPDSSCSSSSQTSGERYVGSNHDSQGDPIMRPGNHGYDPIDCKFQTQTLSLVN